MIQLKVSGIEAQICQEIAQRQQAGVKKYGATLAENPAAVVARLQHFKEEMLDGAAYAEWIIQGIKRQEDDLK